VFLKSKKKNATRVINLVEFNKFVSFNYMIKKKDNRGKKIKLNKKNYDVWFSANLIMKDKDLKKILKKPSQVNTG
jgi:hypothetical protein